MGVNDNFPLDTSILVSYCPLMETFSAWLQSEMDKRFLSQADLAREAGVTRAAINRVLTETRRPGTAVCRGIAKAFGLDEEDVMIRAGHMTRRAEDMGLDDWIAVGRKLTEEERAELLEWAYAKIARRDR